MHTALMVILAIVSVFLIISVLLQSGNSDGLSGSIAGGAEQLFGKKKSSGYDLLLKRLTIIAAIAFIILSLVIVTIY
ncbi:MAG: preprotein translocase subunit SecG [Eubacterium sp.]|nr:preprotein translocase subunit SecG [Eubacterium sp.]